MEREKQFKNKFSVYLVEMYGERAAAGNPITMQEDKPEQRRARFEKYIDAKIEASGMAPEEMETEKEGLMRAYDAWESGEDD